MLCLVSPDVVEVKSSQSVFLKVAQKVANAVLDQSEVFQNSAKSCTSFGLLLLEILLPRNSPIWSHW